MIKYVIKGEKVPDTIVEVRLDGNAKGMSLEVGSQRVLTFTNEGKVKLIPLNRAEAGKLGIQCESYKDEMYVKTDRL